ncbi:hypothetical protein L596_027207 [Steinernema carpocapsae]|uniref:Uncharacterized protein n=1 Tax=Steinernema carpocapsae TaxID=34508 RepID=A0A4U5M3P7_STECR|nr:hypothetical protein L596_027207 [Steinernema carpocapsae]
MDGPSPLNAQRFSLWKAEKLAARYVDSDDLELRAFLKESQVFIKRCMSIKAAPFVDEAKIDKQLSQTLSLLPKEIVYDILNHDEGVKEGFVKELKGKFGVLANKTRLILAYLPVNVVHDLIHLNGLKDTDVRRVGGTYGSVAGKLNYCLAFLPPEIIYDLVTQPGISEYCLEKFLGLQGPFGTLASQQNRVINVTAHGAHRGGGAYGRIGERFQLTNIQQLKGVWINSIKLLLDCDQPSSEAQKTVHIALHGYYEKLEISTHSCKTDWRAEFLRNSFENLPEYVPASKIEVRDNRFAKTCRPLQNFLIRAVSQNRRNQLDFNYEPHGTPDLTDVVISAFVEGRMGTCYYCETVLNTEQTQRLIYVPDFLPKHDRSEIHCKTNFRLDFANFVESIGGELVENEDFKIVKRHFNVKIGKRGRKLTVVIVKEDHPELENDGKEEDNTEHDPKNTAKKRGRPATEAGNKAKRLQR